MDYIQIQSATMCVELQEDKVLIKYLALIFLLISIENKTTIGLLSLCWANQTTALRAKLGIMYFCEFQTGTFGGGGGGCRLLALPFSLG